MILLSEGHTSKSILNVLVIVIRLLTLSNLGFLVFLYIYQHRIYAGTNPTSLITIFESYFFNPINEIIMFFVPLTVLGLLGAIFDKQYRKGYLYAAIISALLIFLSLFYAMFFLFFNWIRSKFFNALVHFICNFHKACSLCRRHVVHGKPFSSDPNLIQNFLCVFNPFACP